MAGKLYEEYIEILQRDNPATKNFWDLEDRIYHDKRGIGVVIDIRRSKMVENMFCLIRDNVIAFEDLSEFSDELKEDVQTWLDLKKRVNKSFKQYNKQNNNS